MKLFVIALLACNLVIVGYHALDEDAATAPDLPDQWQAPDVPTLTMLSEMPPSKSSIVDSRQCFSAGPFETLGSLQVVKAALEGQVIAMNERESEALVELGYWVALPAEETFAEAGAAMAGLNRAGLHDVAVVSDESGEYRVSLGYFLDESNARRRRDQAREAGFEAETRLQRESQPRYWLDFETHDPSIDIASQTRKIPCST